MKESKRIKGEERDIIREEDKSPDDLEWAWEAPDQEQDDANTSLEPGSRRGETKGVSRTEELLEKRRGESGQSSEGAATENPPADWRVLGEEGGGGQPTTQHSAPNIRRS